MPAIRGAADAGRLLPFDQGLVKPAARLVGQAIFQHFQGSEIFACPSGNVIVHARHPNRTDAAQNDLPLAVLGRLFRVSLIELSPRLLERAEILHDVFERFLLIEFASDDEHRVIDLVILAIKGLEALDRHAFDIGPIANRRFAVIVPFISDCHHPLLENVLRVVLAHLELIANDGHFREQIFALHVAIDQPIRFELDAEFQVLVARGHGLVIVRSIHPCRAVETCPVIAQRSRHIRESWRAFEEHVFEQMRHAGFAIAFKSRTDKDCVVDRDERL